MTSEYSPSVSPILHKIFLCICAASLEAHSSLHACIKIPPGTEVVYFEAQLSEIKPLNLGTKIAGRIGNEDTLRTTDSGKCSMDVRCQLWQGCIPDRSVRDLKSEKSVCCDDPYSTQAFLIVCLSILLLPAQSSASICHLDCLARAVISL